LGTASSKVDTPQARSFRTARDYKPRYKVHPLRKIGDCIRRSASTAHINTPSPRGAKKRLFCEAPIGDVTIFFVQHWSLVDWVTGHVEFPG